MSFKHLLKRAKNLDSAAQAQILRMYQPLIRRAAKIDGVVDEDLYQYLCLRLLHCVDVFRLDYQPKVDSVEDLQCNYIEPRVQ